MTHSDISWRAFPNHDKEGKTDAHEFRNVHLNLSRVPLAITYAYLGERDKSLEIAEKAISIVNTINAPGMKRQFAEYTSYALPEVFPGDSKVHTFVATMKHQLLPSETSV